MQTKNKSFLQTTATLIDLVLNQFSIRGTFAMVTSVVPVIVSVLGPAFLEMVAHLPANGKQ